MKLFNKKKYKTKQSSEIFGSKLLQKEKYIKKKIKIAICHCFLHECVVNVCLSEVNKEEKQKKNISLLSLLIVSENFEKRLKIACNKQSRKSSKTVKKKQRT